MPPTRRPVRLVRSTTRLTLLLTLLLAVLATVATTLAPAPLGGFVPAGSAARMTEPFRAGIAYSGSFPDPTILRVGDQYVAASTTIASLNLPMMTSSDLVRWMPRPALPDYRRFTSWRGYNESMPFKPAWAATTRRRDKVLLMSQWAPSLEKIGDHYVAAFSAAVRLTPRHSCIGLATSAQPLGLYQPVGTEPLVCYRESPLGAIDPELFIDPATQLPYLLWKNEGIPGVHSPRLMIRQLNPTGTAFADGSQPVMLATRDQAWEGGVVENPSMVFFRGRYYLLYSGNAWMSDRYATGYATCAGPLGPCRKRVSTPLLASGGGSVGPGGADAFVDAEGRLRMVYAAWKAGRVGGDGARHLHVATLWAGPKGFLRVTARG